MQGSGEHAARLPRVLGHTVVVGFNPYRKYRANRTDYVLIAAVFAAAIAMVAWAFFA